MMSHLDPVLTWKLNRSCLPMLTDFVDVGVNSLEYEFARGTIANDDGIDESASRKGDIFVRKVETTYPF